MQKGDTGPDIMGNLNKPSYRMGNLAAAQWDPALAWLYNRQVIHAL